MNVLIHCYMDRSSALLEGEVCYIEVSVVRKGVTQQAAQGCSRQQQPIGGLDILYLNNKSLRQELSLTQAIQTNAANSKQQPHRQYQLGNMVFVSTRNFNGSDRSDKTYLNTSSF